jgi:hypothetical protein
MLPFSSPQSVTHRDATRPHLEVYMPSPHSNRRLVSPTETQPSLSAKLPKSVAPSQVQYFKEFFSLVPTAALPAPSDPSAANQRNATSCDADAACTSVPVAVSGNSAADLSFVATMIEYSCPSSQPVNNFQQQPHHEQQHQRKRHELPHQQQRQQPQTSQSGQQPRERQLKRDACAMHWPLRPQEPNLTVQAAASSASAADHLHVSQTSNSKVLFVDTTKLASCLQTQLQSQARSPSADWSLATEILLRKTRTECCRTLLRRHCSRHLHAVMLHWRLASVCSLNTNGGGLDLCAIHGSDCSCDKSALHTLSQNSVVKRVTWDCRSTSPISIQGDGGGSRGGTGISMSRVGGMSLSASWNANVAAAAASLTSKSHL